MQVDLNKILATLVEPIVEFKNQLRIEVREEDVIYCTIYAAPSDMGRLIGRRGSVANNIQQVVRSFSRIPDKKILISVVEYND